MRNMWNFKIIETGFFDADGGAMFGAIPKRAWSRKYKSTDDNCCKLAMNCVLLWNENRRVLIDTGVGSKDLGKLSYYNFSELVDIRHAIKAHGFSPLDITDVVLSHLHFDHCGGCTYLDCFGELRVSFPAAMHYVSRAQWENYKRPNVLEKDSFRPEDMTIIEASKLLTLVESDGEIIPNLSVALAGGHTEGQLVVSFESGGNLILVPGDVVPTSAHRSDLWLSAYDVSPLRSVGDKIKLKEIAKNRPSTTIFYHDAYNKSK
ncbi:glyoxylase-like metal-dependent hydrolase (beta-lactamase superfamily II) [Dysgonomonadaceae bacterium PH5-43]|nr:glyoxylase-like metal-dependent hydrolase (beta-lactamase superfamily II) [Dysgonomonadaceae bacterium PH5-43]